MAEEQKRKTKIPVVSHLTIVNWLLTNCSSEEISFMATLAADKGNFRLLNSIFTRLTDYNIHQVFFVENLSASQLEIFRASRRGEVAGLKAFARACQLANEELEKREK